MWEFWRTLIPAAIAIIPSFFLYKQNKQSGEREQTAQKDRLDNELALRKLDGQAESERLAEERERAANQAEVDSISRYLTAAQKLRFEALASLPTDYVFSPKPETLHEIALAYEDVMVRSDAILRTSLEGADDAVNELLAHLEKRSIRVGVEVLEDRLRQVRATWLRHHVGPLLTQKEKKALGAEEPAS